MSGNDNDTYGFSKADAEELVEMIGGGETEYTEGRVKAGGQSGIIIMTPSGGIPARSGTTVGKADCTVYAISSSDVLASTGRTVSVVNIAAAAVAGSVYGQAKRAAGRWVIDYEECGG